MLIEKHLKLSSVLVGSAMHIGWITAWVALVAAGYHWNVVELNIPWLPVSIIGTAVAFFVGFKNNQAYQRLWEARKIWGGIVNDSRTWGMMVNSYVSNQFSDQVRSEEELQAIKKRLVYRHIAWLYAHRSQLLVPTPWEHVSQGGFTGRQATFLRKIFGHGMVDDEYTRAELDEFLPDEERDRLIDCVNTATQIIDQQSCELAVLREKNLIDDFRHVELVTVLRSFYALQGKNERIKKFPFPRQYANMGRHFVFIFIFLLPFSMIPSLFELQSWHKWIAVPLTGLIAWVYMMMEEVGDYTENPFQGLPADIPMLSLCRTIEIDLREMLGETDLPPAIANKKGVLM